MHALAAIFALLSAACGIVVVRVTAKQRRAARATLADIAKEKVHHEGTPTPHPGQLNSLLHQIAHNDIEIGFAAAGVLFAVLAAGLTLFAALM